MDDRKFDDLTRFIGRRASRRAVVKGAAAAALAAVFGRAAADDNTAEAAILIQGGVRQRVRVFCNQAGQKCKNSLNPTRRCCYRCNGSGSNAKCCEAEGYACVVDSDCCDGRICRDPNLTDGVNLKGCFDGGDLPVGAECLDNSECSSNACAEGACCDVANFCDVDPYDPNAGQCCDPYTELCTSEGCCPLELECNGQCCDPYTETCDFYSGNCVSIFA
jgi:hypothetical protein